MNYIEAIRQYKPSDDQELNDQKVILKFIEENQSNVLTRENEVAHLTSSGLVLNESLDKVLMVHHNIYNTWAWTGGHADGEEDMLEVAVREAIEETGVQAITPLFEEIASVDIIPVYGHVKRGRFVSSHLHMNVSYVLIADENEDTQIKHDENSGVMWVSVDELAHYSGEPYLVAIYEKIIAHARAYKRQNS